MTPGTRKNALTKTSTYIRRALMPDEELFYDSSVHWIYSFIGFFWLVVLCVSGVLLIHYYPRYAGAIYDIGGEVAFDLANKIAVRRFSLFLEVVGVVYFIAVLIRRFTTEVVITTRRVIYKHGWLVVDAEEISLDEVEGDYVQQNILGSTLGFGRVVIVTEHMGKMFIPLLEQPLQFRKALESALIEFRKFKYRPFY